MENELIGYLGKDFQKEKLIRWAKFKYYEEEYCSNERVRNAYVKLKDIGDFSSSEAIELIHEYDFEPHYDLIMKMLTEFTFSNPDYELIDNAVDAFRDSNIHVIYDSKMLIFNAADLSFTAEKLSNRYPEILRFLDDIETRERQGKCHPYSLLLALDLQMNGLSEYFDVHLVTDRIYELSRKSKFLHSWVEIENGNIALVFDPTRNLVVDRDVYYEICHVKTPEKVKSKQLVEDFPKVRKLLEYDSFLVKVYYENAEDGRMLYDKLVEFGEIKENQPCSN